MPADVSFSSSSTSTPPSTELPVATLAAHGAWRFRDGEMEAQFAASLTKLRTWMVLLGMSAYVLLRCVWPLSFIPPYGAPSKIFYKDSDELMPTGESNLCAPRFAPVLRARASRPRFAPALRTRGTSPQRWSHSCGSQTPSCICCS